MKPEGILFKFTWISLAIIGVSILIFGLIVTVWPGSSDPLFLRAIGVASIRMGLFGVLIHKDDLHLKAAFHNIGISADALVLRSQIPARISSRFRPHPQVMTTVRR